MSKQTLKVSVTDSKFLESAANKISVNHEEWFYMPFWFHKAADGVYVKYPFNELPDHVKNYINKERELQFENQTLQP